MMNPKIIIVVLFFAIQLTVRGQVSFPTNTSGKIEISDVISDSLTKDELYSLGSTWFKSLSKAPGITVKSVNEDPQQKNISGELEFTVYSQSGVFQKVLGLVTYDLSLTVKDYKYRYVYSNFVFHQYKQDRYYKSVSTGKTKPLEETEARGWQNNWDICREATDIKISNQIKSLKAGMVPVTVVAPPKKIEW